jgi:branched-chain amino acid transport system substrate-binding protein
MDFLRLNQLRQAFQFAVFLAIGSLSVLPQAAKAELIAISVPLTGDFAEIGNDFAVGAKLAIEQSGVKHELFIADDACDKDLAVFAAKGVLSSNPDIMTGMICNEVAIAYANTFRDSGIPLLVSGAGSVRLLKDREREDWKIWRMSAGDDAVADAIADYISQDLKDTPFALVDDGTIYGRTTTDAIRLRLNDLGIKAQFTDSFRAAQSTQSGLLRRLERSGVSIGFIAAATTDDLLTIAKDHTRLGQNYTLVMSEQIATMPFLEDAETVNNGMLVMMKPGTETLKSAAELSALLNKRSIEPSQAIYDGYASTQLAIAALGENRKATVENLKNNRFDTIKGTIEFDENGQNKFNPYQLHEWNGGNLVPLKTSQKNQTQ